jgi:hypothetical protein
MLEQRTLATEADAKFSAKYLQDLHQLGRAYYRLENYVGALDVARRVASWNLSINGEDSLQYARALLNVATVANSLGLTNISKPSIERALRIVQEQSEGGVNARESIQVFAKMVQFGLYDAEDKPTGITQEEYLEAISETPPGEL